MRAFFISIKLVTWNVFLHAMNNRILNSSYKDFPFSILEPAKILYPNFEIYRYKKNREPSNTLFRRKKSEFEVRFSSIFQSVPIVIGIVTALGHTFSFYPQ